MIETVILTFGRSHQENPNDVLRCVDAVLYINTHKYGHDEMILLYELEISIA